MGKGGDGRGVGAGGGVVGFGDSGGSKSIDPLDPSADPHSAPGADPTAPATSSTPIASGQCRERARRVQRDDLGSAVSFRKVIS